MGCNWECNNTVSGQREIQLNWDIVTGFCLLQAVDSCSFWGVTVLFHYLTLYSIIILPSTTRSSIWSFSLRVQTNTFNVFLFATIHATCPSHLIPLHLMNRVTFCGLYLLLIGHYAVFFSKSPATSSTLRPKYRPQHPFLEHLQPVFFPRCERPSSTPTWILQEEMHLCMCKRCEIFRIFVALNCLCFINAAWILTGCV